MLQYRTKVDIIYDLLIEAISTGRYKQGDRIVISSVAKEYNTSEIPVREAIRRLESESFVTVVPNQGPIVSGFSVDTLMSVFHIKSALEGYASRLAIDYLTPADIAELRELNRQIAKQVEENNVTEYAELNKQFHLSIYSHIPMKTFYDTIVDFWRRWSMTRFLFSVVPIQIQRSIAEHDEIIRLLEAKEYDKVEFFVRKHKLDAWNEMLHAMEERGDL